MSETFRSTDWQTVHHCLNLNNKYSSGRQRKNNSIVALFVSRYSVFQHRGMENGILRVRFSHSQESRKANAPVPNKNRRSLYFSRSVSHSTTCRRCVYQKFIYERIRADLVDQRKIERMTVGHVKYINYR